ncbi:unnamed protein product [Chondrus crispus]|uniref:Uncharacterized protein n=1 Tax=Chondrus crispus TaxID=2769 RepID=R7QN67_CHOCR|nr:unnamed protein product [Chondrus crispus]CDF39519.1 unnamed protein product [Chondrus crispus]|eukprot:XP_005719430.1 unnamed protein product [Chondrus crispus]
MSAVPRIRSVMSCQSCTHPQRSLISLSTSHTRTVSPQDADTTYLPPALIPTLRPPSLCPVKAPPPCALSTTNPATAVQCANVSLPEDGLSFHKTG